jgi:hypothetical protein
VHGPEESMIFKILMVFIEFSSEMIIKGDQIFKGLFLIGSKIANQNKSLFLQAILVN